MKHNERARVAPLYLTFTHPFRTQKKMQRAHHAHALRLGVWFACSLWSAFSGLARSAHLDPSACSLNARGARSLTNSALLPELARCASFLKSLVFAANSLWGGAPRRLSRPRENSQQKRETVAITVRACVPAAVEPWPPLMSFKSLASKLPTRYARAVVPRPSLGRRSCRSGAWPRVCRRGTRGCTSRGRAFEVAQELL
jgi:hypothetical protein